MIRRFADRFEEFLWHLGVIAGRLGLRAVQRRAWDWLKWRTNYAPFGRRRSRRGPGPSQIRRR